MVARLVVSLPLAALRLVQRVADPVARELGRRVGLIDDARPADARPAPRPRPEAPRRAEPGREADAHRREAARAAAEAIAHRRDLPPSAQPADETPPMRPAPNGPSSAEAARERARRRQAEEAAAGGVPGPGPELRVAEPWPGYDRMKAAEVVARLRGADAALRALVRAYESTHRGRATVLRATGRRGP